MHRCPHCHFPSPATAERCGWCAKPLVAQQVAAGMSPYPPSGALLSAPPPGRMAGQASSFLVDQPPPAVAAPPAVSGISGSGDSGSAAPDHPGQLGWSTVPGYVPLTTGHITGAAPSQPVWGMSQPLPPPAPPRPWWLLIPIATALIAWGLAHGQPVWGHALTTAARVLCAGAVALVFAAVALGSWQRTLRAACGPALVGLLLAGLGLGSWALAKPVTYLQAQAAENGGDYARAINLYLHIGSANDAQRARVEWGQALTDQNDYATAQDELEFALSHTQGPLHDTARAAMGHLLWQWGSMLFARHDITDTRAKWAAAVALAEGTADADRAAAALDAPQSVTGHMTWHGQPLPGAHVALVSSWKFSPQFHILQVQGTRLEGMSGDDGSFTITGAQPGVLYILIWQGQYGDVTRVAADGTPLYSIMLQPLQGGSLGTVSIDG
jgi:hypothetical protein